MLPLRWACNYRILSALRRPVRAVKLRLDGDKRDAALFPVGVMALTSIFGRALKSIIVNQLV